ncbi:MAG: head-tail connector protein [Romboutsia sp.]
MIEEITFSGINVEHCKKYLNIEDDFKDDDTLLQICLLASKDYIASYTSLSIDKLDKISSINIVVLLLVTEMYSRRSASGGYETAKVNFVLKSILDMNRVWL